MEPSDITGQTEGQPSLFQHATKYGVIMGAVSIVLVVALYAISIEFLVTLKFLFLIIVIGVGLVIYAGINYRNEVGGFLSYGKAFQHGMAVLVVSGAISTLFNIVLYTVVDPELGQKLTEASVINTEEMMRGFGTPDATIDQTISEMRKTMADQFTAVGLLYSYAKAIIGYAIFALITSLFVRKNVPVDL